MKSSFKILFYLISIIYFLSSCCKEPTQLDKNKKIVENSCWCLQKEELYRYVQDMPELGIDTFIDNNPSDRNYHFDNSNNAYLIYSQSTYFSTQSYGHYSFLNENQIKFEHADSTFNSFTIALNVISDNEISFTNTREIMWSQDTVVVDSIIKYLLKETCPEEALNFDLQEE